jgi:LysR family transcriptional regulator, transcriptional activator of nhaA
MWINYHHLYYFKTIAEEQSVSKAAQKLRLGQPTLSAQLKQFEDILEVQLFDRKHKRLILTEQGRIALQYAQSIFRLGDEMVDTLQDRIKPEKIKIQIGALDSISKNLLTEITESCLSQFSCQIIWIEGSLDYLLKQLYIHKLDLVVSNYLPKSKDSHPFLHRLVKKSQVLIYGNKNFKSLKKNFPESLRDQNFILPTHDSQMREDIEHWFKSRRIKYEITVESQDTALKKQLALRGVGIIPSTESSLRDAIENESIFELGLIDEVHENIYFVSSERKITNPPADFLMQKFNFR